MTWIIRKLTHADELALEALLKKYTTEPENPLDEPDTVAYEVCGGNYDDCWAMAEEYGIAYGKYDLATDILALIGTEDKEQEN